MNTIEIKEELRHYRKSRTIEDLTKTDEELKEEIFCDRFAHLYREESA